MSSALTEKLLNGLPDAVLVIGPDGKGVFANSAAKALFDVDVVGQDFGLPLQDFAVVQVVSKGHVRNLELRVADASVWQKGTRAVVLRDVTEREKLALSMQEKVFELNGLADLLRVTPIPIARVSQSGKLLWVNTAFETTFGHIKLLSEIPILSVNKEKMKALFDLQKVQSTAKAKARTKVTTVAFEALSESEMPMVLHSVELAHRKGEKSGAEFAVLFSALEASDELLQAYLSLVFSDVALGLPNERGLLLQSESDWINGTIEQSTFVVLAPTSEPAELDSVMERVMSLIHSFWDEIVPKPTGKAADQPQVPLRVGRISPNILGCVISLPRDSKLGAADAANTLTQKITNAARDDISVGVVLDTRASASLKIAFEEAVFAAQVAEELGEPSHSFQDDYSDVLERRRALTSAVRTAVENKSFELEYQPRMDSRTGKIVSAEVLARCVDPVLGTIQPSEFIPVLRRLNLMSELTEIVGQLAIKQLSKWQKSRRKTINLSINIVPSDLSSTRALSVLRSMARQFGKAGAFELELAESDPFPVAGHSKLKSLLSELGIELSLDDFGTGYSSFAYLISLPISVIKIDKSFIDDLLLEPRKVAAIALIRSIVALARELKLSVCAEGVESQEQLDILIPIGIDEIQGYFFSKPLTAKDFEAKYL